jgi:hypothetical protein
MPKTGQNAPQDAHFAALLTSDRRLATRHIIGTAMRDTCPSSRARMYPSGWLSSCGRWFQTAFSGAADTCPPWTDLQAALLHYFTRRYTAAGAYIALHGARRLPGSMGPEAVQRVAELVLALSLKGVPLTAGQLTYVYQNQLSEEEFSRWSAAANAHHEVSDAAFATLESTAVSSDRGTTSRLSCSGATREH